MSLSFYNRKICIQDWSKKKHQIDSDRVRSVLPHFDQYFIYIMAVCIIGRGNGGVE